MASTNKTPYSEEAEKGILGSAFVSPRDVIGLCIETISPAHFFIPSNQTIYGVLVDLWQKNAPIDLITFTQALRDRRLLEAVGGPAYVTELACFVPTAANVRYYLGTVQEKYSRRQLIWRSTELVRIAYDEENDLDQVLNKAEEEVLSMRITDTEKIQHISNLVQSLEDRIVHAWQHRGDPAAAAGGLSTGIYDLDRMTGGLKPEQLWIVGARTSHGKTSFLLNLATHIALKEKKSVGIFSMEMSRDSIINRLGANLTGLTIQGIKDGNIPQDFKAAVESGEVRTRSEALRKQICEKLMPLKNSRIWIDDSPALETNDLKARARRIKTVHKVDLIVVDYLQKMFSDTDRARKSRVIEVTEIAQCLKNLAKELKIPVLAAAQLNRNPSERKSAFGYPRLSDLRESGDIENEADVCVLLWRPERECDGKEDYEKLAKKIHITATDPEVRDSLIQSFARLILAKQRDGAVGEIPMTFEGARTVFKGVNEAPYSSHEEERQQHYIEEPDPKDYLATVREVFPNAEVTGKNGEE